MYRGLIFLIETALRTHMAHGNIFSCSDGSASTNSATFGFVISTLQGLRLARGNGPAPGSYPNSFRSEAYGVLATLRWLRFTMMRLDVEPPSPIQIKHLLDNKAVIQRIRSTIRMRRSTPNSCLLPEQNVIVEIATTWRALHAHIVFEWVKGHQDLTRHIHSLPLEGQLNCEADREASRVNRYDAVTHALVTPLPSSPCQFIVRHKSITNNFKQKIYQSITIPALETYLRQKYAWDQPTHDDIDWVLFAHIIKKYQNQRTL